MNLSNQFNNRDEHKHFKDVPHQSVLYIDSDDRVITPVSTSISRAFYRSEEIIRQEVHQLGVSKMHLKYNIPVINARNSTISFISSVTGLTHTENIPEGYYPTPEALLDAIEVILNILTGASGITFTNTKVVDSNNTFVFSGDFAFQFISCPHCDRAAPSSGLTPMAASATSVTVIAKNLYTSYIDICIPSLREGQTRPNTFAASTSFSNSDHIFRQHVNQFRNVYSDITVDEYVHMVQYNKIRQRRLTELEIRLYDEFGELIEAPDNVPYVSYAMEISLLS